MSTIIRWNPLREMAALQNTMNRLFDDNWSTLWSNVDTAFTLPIDVYESDGGYTLVANIPGVTQDNIDITLNRNVLTLSVNVPQMTPQDGLRARDGTRARSVDPPYHAPMSCEHGTGRSHL